LPQIFYRGREERDYSRTGYLEKGNKVHEPERIQNLATSLCAKEEILKHKRESETLSKGRQGIPEKADQTSKVQKADGGYPVQEQGRQFHGVTRGRKYKSQKSLPY